MFLYDKTMADIHEDMLIEEVITKYPQTVGVFMRHRIPCLACGEPLWGTIRENAERYGADLELLMQDLRKAARESPSLFLDVGDQESK